MSTADYLQKQSSLSGILEDSRIEDTGTGCLIVHGCLEVEGTVQATALYVSATPPAAAPADHYGVYVVPGGRIYLVPPGGGAAFPLLQGGAYTVPRYNATGDGLETGRLVDDPTSAYVESLAPLSLPYLSMQVLEVPPSPPPAGYLLPYMTASGLALLTPAGETIPIAPCEHCPVDGGTWTTPAGTCETAVAKDFGEEVSGALAGPDDEHWYRFGPTEEGWYGVEAIELGEAAFVEWHHGTECIGTIIPSNPVFIPEGWYIWARILRNTPEGDASYTVRVIKAE